MHSPILVTGDTGTLGRLVTSLLRDAGLPVRVLSRRSHEPGPHQPTEDLHFVKGDLATGAGVAAAVAGVRTIVHCAGSAKGDDAKARTLVAAARDSAAKDIAARDSAARDGAAHLVYISVVGAERVPVVSRADRGMFGYFAAKRAAELIVADSGLPWTTLRATQFHDLTLSSVRQLARLPVVPIPAGFRFQPVDTGEVATRLAPPSPRTGPSAAGPGRTSSPSGCR